MYRIIQSFKPGEISPEEANRIGYELAMKFTEGKYQFVVATIGTGKTVPAGGTEGQQFALFDLVALGPHLGGKGAGYERWAKVFNLKEAAKTLNFLIENDLKSS